jgi:hypothetical protein
MTRFQQMALLGQIGNRKQVDQVQTFNTLAEVQAWRQANGKVN